MKLYFYTVLLHIIEVVWVLCTVEIIYVLTQGDGGGMFLPNVCTHTALQPRRPTLILWVANIFVQNGKEVNVITLRLVPSACIA
jgi:hypothetical protein